MRRLVFLLLLLSLTQCATGPTQGPPVEMEELLQPTRLPEPPAPPPPLTAPAGPPTQADTFRAWVLPRVSATGEVIDGHWATLKTTPPALLRVEPEKVIPRPPRIPMAPKTSTRTPGPAAASAAPRNPAAPLPGTLPVNPDVLQQIYPNLGQYLKPSPPGAPGGFPGLE